MTFLELRNEPLYNRFITEADAGHDFTFCSLMRRLVLFFHPVNRQKRNKNVHFG